MIEIFTDGACSQNGTQDGGWAFVVRENGVEIYTCSEGAKDTTNNEMELLAFMNALDYAAIYHKGKIVKLYTDSAYVSNTFAQQWYKRWILNGYRNAKRQEIAHVNIWKNIFSNHLENIENGKVQVIKVKGHGDNDGNIRADYLATKAKDEVGK